MRNESTTSRARGLQILAATCNATVKMVVYLLGSKQIFPQSASQIHLSLGSLQFFTVLQGV